MKKNIDIDNDELFNSLMEDIINVFVEDKDEKNVNDVWRWYLLSNYKNG